MNLLKYILVSFFCFTGTAFGEEKQAIVGIPDPHPLDGFRLEAGLDGNLVNLENSEVRIAANYLLLDDWGVQVDAKWSGAGLGVGGNLVYRLWGRVLGRGEAWVGGGQHLGRDQSYVSLGFAQHLSGFTQSGRLGVRMGFGTDVFLGTPADGSLAKVSPSIGFTITRNYGRGGARGRQPGLRAAGVKASVVANAEMECTFGAGALGPANAKREVNLVRIGDTWFDASGSILGTFQPNTPIAHLNRYVERCLKTAIDDAQQSPAVLAPVPTAQLVANGLGTTFRSFYGRSSYSPTDTFNHTGRPEVVVSALNKLDEELSKIRDLDIAFAERATERCMNGSRWRDCSQALQTLMSLQTSDAELSQAYSALKQHITNSVLPSVWEDIANLAEMSAQANLLELKDTDSVTELMAKLEPAISDSESILNTLKILESPALQPQQVEQAQEILKNTQTNAEARALFLHKSRECSDETTVAKCTEALSVAESTSTLDERLALDKMKKQAQRQEQLRTQQAMKRWETCIQDCTTGIVWGEPLQSDRYYMARYRVDGPTYCKLRAAQGIFSQRDECGAYRPTEAMCAEARPVMPRWRNRGYFFITNFDSNTRRFWNRGIDPEILMIQIGLRDDQLDQAMLKSALTDQQSGESVLPENILLVTCGPKPSGT